MAKTRRERCPHCGFLEVIKWGYQCGHQRYKCKNCGSLFTFRDSITLIVPSAAEPNVPP